MSITTNLRLLGLSLALLTGGAIAFISLSASITVGSLTPANAQPATAQSSEDMQAALEAYGSWQPHPRYGQVWVPTGAPRDWRPYEYGHWVYTDDWGWYWVSDEVEEDWGWVTYHYGRWGFERRLGWFWVPGDEWAPAWVDWRYGDDYIGWAALPPDDLIDAYDAEPALWVFVPSRYMTAPRLRSYIVSPDRRVLALRSTRLVNRTVAVRGARLAVNPGISPAFVAAVTRAALPSYRVRPRVFGSTQGVSGAVQVRSGDLRGARPGGANGRTHVNAISVQRTTTMIQPVASAAKPEALSKGSGGQLGTHPPRAAQGGAAPQQQQQQSPAQKTTPPTTPPAGAPLRSGPAPITAPATPPSPPPNSGPAPTGAPTAPPSPPPTIGPARQEPPRSAPREERRDQGPPAGNQPAAHPGEPLPQAKPVRPIAPQTPPPPPPAQLAPRQPAPPPPVTQPAPPPHPVAPVAAPPPPPAVRAPPPPPPPAAKQAPPPPAAAKPATPGEKPAEAPK